MDATGERIRKPGLPLFESRPVEHFKLQRKAIELARLVVTITDGVTTKSSVTGARRGLGLALVRQIAESMGGMVSVGHDGGAVFTAMLPGCLDAEVAVPRPRVVS